MSFETSKVENPVECDICERKWVDQEALNLHLKIDHGLNLVKDLERKTRDENVS